MQLVKGGPDISVKILQALEDGKLVFFCGAGVSVPAGLPSFPDLVRKVMDSLSENLNSVEDSEYQAGNYDRVFTLIERRLGSDAIRGAVRAALVIDPTKSDLSTHRALLDLSKRPSGYRLVTTNFDHGFELAALGKPLSTHAAPLLPVPKHQWCSLVHIHGRIDDTDPNCMNLVLSSGDFGKAYLTERWASRFITELFRRFTVVFVGYSVSDPVIRYMMDALAADRVSGEAIQDAYVFADYTKRTQTSVIEAWKAKNVNPIPFDRRGKFALLHKTLKEWAAIHRDGLVGKEGIIGRYAHLVPTPPNDETASQVLWAISEPSGHIARVFADHEPLPPLEWLQVFEEEGLLDKALAAPSSEGAPLVDGGRGVSCPQELHPITDALGGWLTRHLEKVDLIYWVIDKGACLHPGFKNAIRRALSNTWCPYPYAITRIWQLLASDLLGCRCDEGDHWFDALNEFRNGPWTPDSKLRALRLLDPYISLSRSLSLPTDSWGVSEGEGVFQIAHYVDAEVKLASETFAREFQDALPAIDGTRLAELADDATSLLVKAMTLLQAVDKASEESDLSYIHLPSIAPHSQNQWYEDWIRLVDIIRVAWECLLATDIERARSVAQRWRTIRFPIFRRLLFHAMSKEGVFTNEEIVSEISVRRAWWLWSVETQHEMYALLRAVWPKLSTDLATRIVEMILGGPPRDMFRDEVEEERLIRIVEREQWKFLSKLETYGRSLPRKGGEHLAELRKRHPEWQLHPGDEDEFPVYSATWAGPPPLEGPRAEELLAMSPRDAAHLLSTVSDHKRESLLHEWGTAVAQRNRWAVGVLEHLVAGNVWLEDVWHAALNGLKDRTTPYVWRHFAQLLNKAPNELLRDGLTRFAWWLRDASRQLHKRYERSFLDLWDRLIDLAVDEGVEPTTKDPVGRALNSSAGMLAEALLNRLSARKPSRHSELPEDLRARFTRITEAPALLLGRVVLASRLGQLFAISPSWTKEQLLRFFRWSASQEASAIWQGYLWVANIYPDLLAEIRSDLIEALRRRGDLGRYARRVCQLFAIAALYFRDVFSARESKAALQVLDGEGLAEVANTLARTLQDAKEKADDMWSNRVSPLIVNSWPKDRDRVHPKVSRALVLAVIHTTQVFPSAFAVIRRYVTRSEDVSLVIYRLNETEHPMNHPQTTLELLDILVAEDRWPPRELRSVLARIAEALPSTLETAAYRRLDEYLRRYGQ